jgi:hypothetical protein
VTPPNSAKRPACKRCGSTHFYLAQFAQYDVFVGGGYHRLSETRQAAVCLCGRPLSTRKLLPHNTVDQSFKESLEAEQKHWEQVGSNCIIGHLRNDFITHAEFEELSQQVSSLEAVLQQLGKKDQKS